MLAQSAAPPTDAGVGAFMHLCSAPWGGSGGAGCVQPFPWYGAWHAFSTMQACDDGIFQAVLFGVCLTAIALRLKAW